MSSLIISVSKDKKISNGFNITTENQTEDVKYQENDLHISNFKFTEEMLEMLQSKIKSYIKKNNSKSIVVIDFINKEAPLFSVELFNRLSEKVKQRIVVVLLNTSAYDMFSKFKDKIKFEGLVFKYDFPANKNQVNVGKIENLNGVFYESGNIYERKKMDYEDD